MKTSPHFSESSYHTWRDIGGPIGLLLDICFFCFVVVGAMLMIVVSTVLVVVDYLVKPILDLMSRFHR